VRNLVERRKVVIAWYTAVTINTVVSYQTFLASYGNSDFALTADRLLARASTRSISDAGAAFAATAPTCPCSVPATPILRQKRTDTAPTQNIKTTKTPGSGVAVVDPVGTVDPVPPVVATPPVIVVPPRITVFPKPPRGKPKPPRHDDDPKPTTGTDKPPTGTDKPPTTGGGKWKPPIDKVKTTGTISDGGGSGGPTILRGRINPRVKLNTNVGTANTGFSSVKTFKPATPSLTTGTGLKATPGISRNIGNVGTPRTSFGRMGVR
jgi:hypothetical protein